MNEDKQTDVLDKTTAEEVVPAPVLTEEEQLELAHTQALQVVNLRVVQYEGLVESFDEGIESYETLIAVVKENEDRFSKARFPMIVEQFGAANDSFKTQRKNYKKIIKKYKKIQLNSDKYSAKEIVDILSK